MANQIDQFALYISECFSYQPNEGILLWKERPLHHFKKKSDQVSWNKRYANTEPGCIKKDYGNRKRPRSVVLSRTPLGDFSQYDCLRVCAILLGNYVAPDTCVFPINEKPTDLRSSNIFVLQPIHDKSRFDSLIEVDYLNECFDADFEAGKLFWKVRPSDHFETIEGWFRFNRIFSGKRAEVLLRSKYLGVQLMRSRFAPYGMLASHRVLWAMRNGSIPSGMVIDHINGDCKDNRECNLRLASHGENTLNRKTKKRKSDLPANVNYAGDKFTVSFGFTTKYYNDRDEACEAAEFASSRWFGEFSRRSGGEQSEYDGEPLTIKVKQFLLGEIDEIVHKKKAVPLAEHG